MLKHLAIASITALLTFSALQATDPPQGTISKAGPPVVAAPVPATWSTADQAEYWRVRAQVGETQALVTAAIQAQAKLQGLQARLQSLWSQAQRACVAQGGQFDDQNVVCTGGKESAPQTPAAKPAK